MENVWAPWRMAYINEPDKSGCFLCDAWRDPDFRKHRVLMKGRSAFVIMNIFPYNNGHLMIAPAEHHGDLASLGPAVRAELMELLTLSTGALASAMSPDGFNAGINLGRVAGAGLPGHIHLHVVPRWSGDTNFMPVVGETKVISEHLDVTWMKLKAAFDRLAG
jgi:ATP adenylyltransferase